MRRRLPEATRERSTKAAERRIAVVYRPVAELKLDQNNPREHSPRQVRQIARSIEAFDFNVPVLIDAQCNVIAGHGRILACQLLGWSEVPTICLAHLSAAQAKAFMIADNRLTENSVWDERLLAEQLKELAILDLDFSLEVPAAYVALLGSEQADMVFIDPPYNVPIADNVSGLGAIRHRDFAMASGEMSEADFTRFLLGAY